MGFSTWVVSWLDQIGVRRVRVGVARLSLALTRARALPSLRGVISIKEVKTSAYVYAIADMSSNTTMNIMLPRCAMVGVLLPIVSVDFQS